MRFLRGTKLGELKCHFWEGNENTGAIGKERVESLNSFKPCRNAAKFIEFIIRYDVLINILSYNI